VRGGLIPVAVDAFLAVLLGLADSDFAILKSAGGKKVYKKAGAASAPALFIVFLLGNLVLLTY
jgi:hypothetical protein